MTIRDSDRAHKYVVEITTQYWHYITEAESRDDAYRKAEAVFDAARDKLRPFIRVEETDPSVRVGDI